jgi:hypothetical protein
MRLDGRSLLTGIPAHCRFRRKVCAVEHTDCASRGAAGSHDGFTGRTTGRPLAKAEPAAEPRFPFYVLLGNSLARG